MSILKEICRYINDINTDRILSCKLDYYNEDIKLKKIYNIHIYNVKLTEKMKNRLKLKYILICDEYKYVTYTGITKELKNYIYKTSLIDVYTLRIKCPVLCGGYMCKMSLDRRECEKLRRIKISGTVMIKYEELENSIRCLEIEEMIIEGNKLTKLPNELRELSIIRSNGRFVINCEMPKLKKLTIGWHYGGEIMGLTKLKLKELNIFCDIDWNVLKGLPSTLKKLCLVYDDDSTIDWAIINKENVELTIIIASKKTDIIKNVIEKVKCVGKLKLIVFYNKKVKIEEIYEQNRNITINEIININDKIYVNKLSNKDSRMYFLCSKNSFYRNIEYYCIYIKK